MAASSLLVLTGVEVGVADLVCLARRQALCNYPLTPAGAVLLTKLEFSTFVLFGGEGDIRLFAFPHKLLIHDNLLLTISLN